MLASLNHHSLRGAMIDWMSGDRFTHAITLNTDRELTHRNLRSIFSTFCHRFDKHVHGRRNVRGLPRSDRLHAIVFPENLSSNAHLHGCADFEQALVKFGCERKLEEVVRMIWLQSTHGAGSVLIEANPDSGWGRYCTKRAEGEYLLSADFHTY